MGLPLETKNGHSYNVSNKATEAEADAESTIQKTSHKTSSIETSIHLFKGCVGAGLFAMGDCFKNGGLVGATVLMPIIAVITVHCSQMLINGSKHAVQTTPGAVFFDYPETVEKCFEHGPKPFRRFSRMMKLIVEMFICMTQFGFCAIYFVFVTENLHQVLEQNGIHMSANTVMLITLLPIMIPSLMTNIKYISPVSLFANFALIFGLVATLVMACKDGNMPSPSERHLITNGSQMSLFFGTALFSYEGIALILPLRNCMRQPEKFNSRFGVLNITLIFITALFVFTGFVTYLRWGEEVQGSITLNLDVHSIISQIIKVVAALGVFFGYPIQFFIMIKILWLPMKQSSNCVQKYPIICQVLLRFIMVLLTFGVALVVPQLGLFISLIGAFCSTSLAFLIPVLIDFVVRSQQSSNSLDVWTYIKNFIILAIAVLGIVTGTYQSIVEIVKEFSK